MHSVGGSGKIEVARNLISTHKIISIEWLDIVCEIFLKKSHHIPAFWRVEVENFCKTRIVLGYSPGKGVGEGILYAFRCLLLVIHYFVHPGHHHYHPLHLYQHIPSSMPPPLPFSISFSSIFAPPRPPIPTPPRLRADPTQ